MKANVLEGIKWYIDKAAKERGEPGICHSFMASLATAISYIAGDVDPVWLMGVKRFCISDIYEQVFVSECYEYVRLFSSAAGSC